MNYQQNFDIIEQLPGYIGWKDKNGYYYGCNNNLASVHRLPSPEKIIGLKDADLFDYKDEFLSLYQDNDRIALSGKIVKAIVPSTEPYDGSLFNLTKKPLLDRENNIIGVLFHCIEHVKPTIVTQLLQTDKKYCAKEFLPKQYRTNQDENPLHLTTRELESLFCILRGKTAKQTAAILNLSKRTIEFYINNIKNKFGCDSKSDLLMMAIRMGYMSIIPSLFQQSEYQGIF